MGNAKIVDELQAFLEKLVVADLFSGAVLIALNGVPIFKKAYGLANKSFNVPNQMFMLPVKGCPAAGGYSTVSDLLNFDIALRQHKLLSYKYTNIVLSGKVAFSDEMFAKYAYGFVDERVKDIFDGIQEKRITGHKGGIPRINAQLDMYLDDGYTVVVLSNYDPPAGQRVAAKLRELINYKQATHPTVPKHSVSR